MPHQYKINPLRQLPDGGAYDKLGRVHIRLAEIMKERGCSMNQLAMRAEMQRTQLRNYRDDKVQRYDIYILLKLCYVLNCDLSDLLEYIPPEEED